MAGLSRNGTEQSIASAAHSPGNMSIPVPDQSQSQSPSLRGTASQQRTTALHVMPCNALLWHELQCFQCLAMQAEHEQF